MAYVTGYTGFSGDSDLQSGNYLALKITDDDAQHIQVSIGDRGPVDVKDDGFVVIRLTADDLSDELVITDIDDVVTETVTLDLSGLTLEEPED